MTHMYSVLSTKCCKNVSQIWLCLKLSDLNASSWVCGICGRYWCLHTSTSSQLPSLTSCAPAAKRAPTKISTKVFRCNNISSTYPYKSVRQHFGGTFFFWHSWSHCLLVFLSISFLWDPGLWGPIFWSGCLTDTVCPSVSKWPCVDLNDVTLADEDTNQLPPWSSRRPHPCQPACHTPCPAPFTCPHQHQTQLGWPDRPDWLGFCTGG